ncbi:MAG: glycosyltransferase [Candidatus Harrisonbacteria bacterium]|nr:glycosyltransferase [Candidatus Harrisonbacteria bacterium]
MNTKNVSIILPVINETFSLEETVKILMDENKDFILEILIMTADKTSLKSRQTIGKLKLQYGDFIKDYRQKLPYLGGAMRDAFGLASGKWVLMMASDLETDPHVVKNLINEANTGNYDIVTASRWMGGAGGFRSYNPIKFFLNFIFQKFFQWLYWTNLSDLTYGFRIFKTDLVQKIRWEELRHPFLLETILKPLRLGARIKEIPCQWHARKEGESQNTFFANFKYFKIAFKVLLSKKENL